MYIFTNIFTYFKYIYLFVIIFCVQLSFDIFAIGSIIPSKVNNKVLRKRDLRGKNKVKSALSVSVKAREASG